MWPKVPMKMRRLTFELDLEVNLRIFMGTLRLPFYTTYMHFSRLRFEIQWWGFWTVVYLVSHNERHFLTWSLLTRFTLTNEFLMLNQFVM